MRVPAFTSTRSKRPHALFAGSTGVPCRAVRSEGCMLWDASGQAYVDMVMALGAVGLGYAHPEVTAAVEHAARGGVVASLSPVLEEEVADLLCSILPGAEQVVFLKSGAEAVAAAVRIARAATGRERVVTCGYHGWHDWCQSDPAVPAAIRGLRSTIPFNDVAAVTHAAEPGPPPAAFVVEPVVDGAPDPAWLAALRDVTARHGSLLVFDEIKTAFRVALGGAAERWGVVPDLAVVGKALANGFPLAAVAGPRDVMEAATRSWISSTLATEWVSLAAARAVIDTYRRDDVCGTLESIGRVWLDGLHELAARYRDVVAAARGVPTMCYLEFVTERAGAAVARAMAHRGVLFKRNAYNFVSAAHTAQLVGDVLGRLDGSLAEVEAAC